MIRFSHYTIYDLSRLGTEHLNSYCILLSIKICLFLSFVIYNLLVGSSRYINVCINFINKIITQLVPEFSYIITC